MKTKLLILTFLIACAFSVSAKRLLAADGLFGTWKYTVSDVPPEYETGFMTFEQKDNKTTGYLGQNERMEMKELVVDGAKVTFKLDFQGGLLTVNLTQDGNKLNGTIVGQEGEFPITAVKEEKK